MLDESNAGGVPGHLVAIKTALSATGDGADELRREALVMAQVLGHPNVVALIGVVTSGLPLMLLLSLCENGSLQECLKEGKCPGQSLLTRATGGAAPSEATSIKFAMEIAKGMHHLVKAKFVHRDLAARNILLDSQFVCKIADFGLSRGVAASNPDDENAREYYTSAQGMFPVRWTAPEAMETMKFSTATDIWSYGIVLLEIVTGGDRPYADLQNNQEVINQVVSGYRAPPPEHGCSDPFYKAMLRCWEAIPSSRPSFEVLEGVFQRMMNQAAESADGGVSGGGSSGSSVAEISSSSKHEDSDHAANSTYAARGGNAQALAANEYAVTLAGDSALDNSTPTEAARDNAGMYATRLPDHLQNEYAVTMGGAPADDQSLVAAVGGGGVGNMRSSGGSMDAGSYAVMLQHGNGGAAGDMASITI